MASVGLLYVGAVLFLNGCMLLGWVDARAAVPLNIFVGVLQVITPTYLIITAHGDARQILAASGLYLFGFTYLYVAFTLWYDLDGSGVGYFSLFVALCAVAYAVIAFREGDYPFGVIWLHWSYLWLLFFFLLGRGREALRRYTGAVAAVQGWATCAIPALLMLTGGWARLAGGSLAIGLAAGGIAVFGALLFLVRSAAPR